MKTWPLYFSLLTPFLPAGALCKGYLTDPPYLLPFLVGGSVQVLYHTHVIYEMTWKEIDSAILVPK
jgi:hypothetical protein